MFVYKLLLISAIVISSIIDFTFAVKLKTITLTNDNFVSLNGYVTSLSISNLIKNLISLPSDNVYIYLNTNGGSVDAGMKLVNVIKTLEDNNINVSCIADKAISMGFVIFQYCSKRYVTRSSTLMQHQMSLSGVSGKIRDINSYIKYVNTMENYINLAQAERIGISFEQFNENIRDDWWLTSTESIKQNVADEIVNIKCTFENKEEIKHIHTIFGELQLVYMKCPQVYSEVRYKFNNINISGEAFENIIYQNSIKFDKFDKFDTYNRDINYIYLDNIHLDNIHLDNIHLDNMLKKDILYKFSVFNINRILDNFIEINHIIF